MSSQETEEAETAISSPVGAPNPLSSAARKENPLTFTARSPPPPLSLEEDLSASPKQKDKGKDRHADNVGYEVEIETSINSKDSALPDNETNQTVVQDAPRTDQSLESAVPSNLLPEVEKQTRQFNDVELSPSLSRQQSEIKPRKSASGEEFSPKRGLRFAEVGQTSQQPYLPTWKDLVVKDDDVAFPQRSMALTTKDERNRSFNGAVALSPSTRYDKSPSTSRAHSVLRKSAENKSFDFSNETPGHSRPATSRTWKVDPAQGPMTVQPWKQNKFSSRTGEYKGGALEGRRGSLTDHIKPPVRTPKSRHVHKDIPLVLWHGETPLDEFHSVVPTGKALRRASMSRRKSQLVKSKDDASEIEELDEEFGSQTVKMFERGNEIPFLMRKFPRLYRFLNRERIEAAERINRTGASDKDIENDDEVKKDRKHDIPYGFVTLRGPNWIFKRWPTIRIVLSLVALLAGVLCFVLASTLAVPAKTPTPQGIVPSIYDRRCRQSSDCVYMANCYQNYCINQATRRNPQYLKPNISDSECQAKFNCLSVVDSSISCVCTSGFCNNVKGCPVDKNAGRWVLIAIGVLCVIFSLPTLLMSKAYTLRFFDETKTLSYTRSFPACPCYGRRQKTGISIFDIEDVYSQQYLKTDRYSATSRHVQMRMPDGYVFTCFLGKVAIAEEEVIKWNQFLEERRLYGEEEDEHLEVLATNFDDVQEKRQKKREVKEWNDADVDVAQHFFEGAHDLDDDGGGRNENWDELLKEEEEVNRKVELENHRRRSIARRHDEDSTDTEHYDNADAHGEYEPIQGAHEPEEPSFPLDTHHLPTEEPFSVPRERRENLQIEDGQEGVNREVIGNGSGNYSDEPLG